MFESSVGLEKSVDQYVPSYNILCAHESNAFLKYLEDDSYESINSKLNSVCSKSLSKFENYEMDIDKQVIVLQVCVCTLPCALHISKALKTIQNLLFVVKISTCISFLVLFDIKLKCSP